MCDQDNPVFLIPERSPESLPVGALRQTLLALRTLESIGARNLHLPPVICLGSEECSGVGSSCCSCFRKDEIPTTTYIRWHKLVFASTRTNHADFSESDSRNPTRSCSISSSFIASWSVQCT